MSIKIKKLFKVFLVLLILLAFISLGNSLVLAVDFDFSQHSFEIEAKGYYRLKVELPEEYNLRPEIEKYYQDNKLIMYRSEDKLAINEDFKYEINLSGYEFSGKGVYLTEEGLYLKEIAIDLEDKTTKRVHYDGQAIDVEGQDNRIVFRDVKISADKNKVLGEYRCKQDYYLRFGELIIKAKESKLTEEMIKFDGSTRMQNLFLDLEIPIRDMELDRKLKGNEVKIKDINFSLFSGTELEVESSKLTQDGWKIDKANLLSEGSNHLLAAEIGNFYIKANAGFTKNEDYYSKATEFNYYGKEYKISRDEIFLSANRILIDKLKRKTETDNLEQEVSVGPVQIADEVYNKIPWLEAKISGMEFEAIDGYRQGEEFLFSTGLLYLEIADEPITIKLEEISYNKNGLDFEQATVKKDKFNYLDYGVVNYNGIEVVEEGFNIQGDFYLAEKFLDEEIKFKIKDFVVNKKGLLSDIKLTDLADEKKIELNGWDVVLSRAILNDLLQFEGEIKLPEIDQFQLPEAMKINELAFDNTGKAVKISAQEENRNELELSEEYKLDLRNLKIEEEDISDELKIYFAGTALYLPDYYTGGYIWLEEINFDNQGKLYHNKIPLDKWFEDYQDRLWQKFN